MHCSVVTFIGATRWYWHWQWSVLAVKSAVTSNQCSHLAAGQWGTLTWSWPRAGGGGGTTSHPRNITCNNVKCFYGDPLHPLDSMEWAYLFPALCPFAGGRGGFALLFQMLPLSYWTFIFGKCCLPPDTPVDVCLYGATSKNASWVDDPSVWWRRGAGARSLEGQFPLLQQNAGHNTPGHHQLQSIACGPSHAPRAAVPMCV